MFTPYFILFVQMWGLTCNNPGGTSSFIQNGYPNIVKENANQQLKLKVMKTNFFSVLFVFFLSVTALTAGTTKGDFDSYVITPVEGQKLGEGVEQAWKISYGEGHNPVMIELYKTRKCKTYVIRTDNFEVAYVCTSRGFGARKLKVSESRIPYEITNQVINSQELERQRIISATPMEENEAVDLIASFLPDLVNPRYKNLLS